MKVPLWKPLAIVAVLLLCGVSLYFPGVYGPKDRLRPGLDLAGGTTLVYEVDVPPGQDATAVIDRTIDVLKKRVDPTGVKNLSWRQLAGNRIEVQMSAPPKATVELREAYLAAKDRLLDNNLSRRDLSGALRAGGEARDAALARLAHGNEALLGQLKAMAAAQDAMQAARQPYEQAQQEERQAAEALEQLPADASAEQRTQMQEHLKEVRSTLITRTRAFVDAREKFSSLQRQVLADNIDRAQLERTLSLPDTAGAAREGQAAPPSPRQAALDKLVADHSSRAEEVRAVATAYTAYEKVKGTLDDANDLIRLLRGSGVLEFRIAPGPQVVGDVQAYREQLTNLGPKSGTDKPYRWFEVDDIKSFAESPQAMAAVEADAAGYFNSRNMIGQRYGEKYYLLLANTRDASITQADEGWELASAIRSADRSGLPAVAFNLNTVGAQLMGQLTTAHKGEPMAIVLDGKVQSAPNINDTIYGNGIITQRGGFGQAEMDYLLRTLNAGALQARLSQQPISIKTTGPQFGQDNLRAGLKAGVYSLIVVMVAMAGYYFLGGMIANAALLVNLVIILGVMAMFDATFTLPGIAGIILTLGMAVDANVLVYERIREELERRAPLPTAMRLGFDRALITIIDSNLTTIITCVILFYMGTVEIRGFAVALGVGLVASMFTAVFCTRVVLEYYVQLTGATTLPMLPTVVPAVCRFFSPNIDWLSKRYFFIGLSAVLGVSGIIAVVSRGEDMFDIEFRSGTQVSFELDAGKQLSMTEVRDRLDRAAQAANSPVLAGDRATVVTVGDTQTRDGKVFADHFSIATLEQDSVKVSEAIKTAFSDVLNIQRPIDFARMDAASVAAAPVYAVRQTDLGGVINRPELADEDVSDYLGGVAIVLQDLSPAPTAEQVYKRIEQMRMQTEFERLGFRNFTVIGLDVAVAGADLTQAPQGQQHYRSVIVVSHDGSTNYSENPGALYEREGLADTEWALAKAALQRDTSLGSVSNFSAAVSDTMKQQAIVALVLSWCAILVYIWLRFGNLRYGLGAIVALVHDSVIAMGMLAMAFYFSESAIGHALGLTAFRIDLIVIAALLTLIGYSVNDTIVVFDRIRENRGRLATASPAIINDSINQTISRTVLTGGTTLLSVIVLYVVGGPGVHGFAFIMLIGVIVGTYSSIAIASPLLLVGEKAAAAKPRPAPVA